MSETNSWRMFAHDRAGTFTELGDRRHVEFHRLPYPIVEVDVTLVADDDPRATHWGWIKADTDGVPKMIWPWEVSYRVCFPYGPEAEEKAGRGRTVRLAVRAVTVETLQYGIRLGGCPVRGPLATEATARYWVQRMSRITPSARLMVTSDGGRTWAEAEL